MMYRNRLFYSLLLLLISCYCASNFAAAYNRSFATSHDDDDYLSDNLIERLAEPECDRLRFEDHYEVAGECFEKNDYFQAILPAQKALAIADSVCEKVDALSLKGDIHYHIGQSYRDIAWAMQLFREGEVGQAQKTFGVILPYLQEDVHFSAWFKGSVCQQVVSVCNGQMPAPEKLQEINEGVYAEEKRIVDYKQVPMYETARRCYKQALELLSCNTDIISKAEESITERCEELDKFFDGYNTEDEIFDGYNTEAGFSTDNLCL